MKQEERDKIKGYYDQTGEWNIRERYSEKEVTVYTKDGDKYHWLVIEENKQGIEVHQTDEDGTIIARDYYRSTVNEICCTGMERMRADGLGMVLFTEKELNLFHLCGWKNKIMKSIKNKNSIPNLGYLSYYYTKNDNSDLRRSEYESAFYR